MVKLNPDGTTATDAGGNPIRVGGFDEPSSVSVVPTDGSCWVADLHNSKLVKINDECAE